MKHIIAGLKVLKPYLIVALLSLVICIPILLHASSLHTDFGHHIEIALQFPAISKSVSHVSHVLFTRCSWRFINCYPMPHMHMRLLSPLLF